MKLIVTLLLLFIQHLAFTQACPITLIEKLANAKDSAVVQEQPTKPAVAFRCSAPSIQRGQPLIVLNGSVLESGKLADLDPDTIEQIWVLKDANATAIYGCRASNGVIIITTKKTAERKFIVKDKETGEALPRATILLRSPQHLIVLTADDLGKAITTDLKPGNKYEAEVTMAGYKAVVIQFENTKEPLSQVIMLEKEIRECEAVVVRSNIFYRRCKMTGTIIQVPECTVGLAKLDPSSSIMDARTGQFAVHIYPNPARRTEAIKIGMQNMQEQASIVRIFNSAGSLVSVQPVAGKAILTVPVSGQWTPGVYFVQLSDKSGKLIKTDQLIIQ
jgi:TonB-dependent SusC/RagA subfamily outer membrane receptor